MKFLKLALGAFVAGTGAIRMNAIPVSHVVIHSNYHDEYDSVPLPTAADIAAAR